MLRFEGIKFDNQRVILSVEARQCGNLDHLRLYPA